MLTTAPAPYVQQAFVTHSALAHEDDIGRRLLISMRTAHASLAREWASYARLGEELQLNISRARAVVDSLFDLATAREPALRRISALRHLANIFDRGPSEALQFAGELAHFLPHETLRAVRDNGEPLASQNVEGYALLRSLLSPREGIDRCAPYPDILGTVAHLERILLQNAASHGDVGTSSSFRDELARAVDLRGLTAPRLCAQLGRDTFVGPDLELAKGLGFPFSVTARERTYRALEQTEAALRFEPPFSSSKCTQALLIHVAIAALSEGQGSTDTAISIAQSAQCELEFDAIAEVLPHIAGKLGTGLSPSDLAFEIARACGDFVRNRPQRDIEVVDLIRSVVFVLEHTPFGEELRSDEMEKNLRNFRVYEWVRIELERTPPYVHSADLAGIDDAARRESLLQKARVARLTGQVSTRDQAVEFLALRGARDSNTTSHTSICGDAPGLSRSKLSKRWDYNGAVVRVYENESFAQYRPFDGNIQIVRDVLRSGAYPALLQEISVGGASPEFFSELLTKDPLINLPELERMAQGLQYWRSFPTYDYTVSNFKRVAGATLLHISVDTPHVFYRCNAGYIGEQPHSGEGSRHIEDGRSAQLKKLSKRTEWPKDLQGAVGRFLQSGVASALASTNGESHSGRSRELYRFKSAPMAEDSDIFVTVITAKLPPAWCHASREERSVATAILHPSAVHFLRFIAADLKVGWKTYGDLETLESDLQSLGPLFEEAGIAPLTSNHITHDLALPSPELDPPQTEHDRQGSAPHISTDGMHAQNYTSAWMMRNVLYPQVARSLFFIP